MRARFVMALSLIGSAALWGCSQFYTVRGGVTRCDSGEPVPNASVSLDYVATTNEHGESQTEKNGDFEVSANDPPGNITAELTVSAPGFRMASRKVHHSYDDYQTVCLEPVSNRP